MAAVTADTRAADVIAKYRKRMDDWSRADKPESPNEFDAIVAELKDDIANAINAAVNEVHIEFRDELDADAKAKAAKMPPMPTRARPATTHMPATGHDKPSAHR